MKIFSGTANTDLAQRICDYISLPLGKINHKIFASGELYCQFQENIRGSDVFLVNPISYPANDNLMQLLLMCDAARRASAGRIVAIIPYFGYGRQDRKDKSRVPISAKLVMDIIAAAGFDRIVTMDLHAPQVGGFTNLPFDHLAFKPTLLNALKDNHIDIDCVVAPDIGSIKKSQEYVEILKKDLAIVVKKRTGDTEVEVTNFIGDVKNKNVLIVDDLTESLKTLMEAAKTCKDNGAKDINVAVTHGCFSSLGSDNLFEALDKKLFTKFFYSNTIPILNTLSKWQTDVFFEDNVIKVDVAPVFATAINRIHKNESVSELFSIL
jgi:ribose-phosphate pyrophosphokinase